MEAEYWRQPVEDVAVDSGVYYYRVYMASDTGMFRGAHADKRPHEKEVVWLEPLSGSIVWDRGDKERMLTTVNIMAIDGFKCFEFKDEKTYLSKEELFKDSIRKEYFSAF